MNANVRIKELSIIGAGTTLFELTRKQEDQELVMLFLKRSLEETTLEMTTIKDVKGIFLISKRTFFRR